MADQEAVAVLFTWQDNRRFGVTLARWYIHRRVQQPQKGYALVQV